MLANNFLNHFNQFMTKYDHLKTDQHVIDGFNTAEVHTIVTIGKNKNISLHELATKRQISTSAASQLTSKLESRGIIKKNRLESNIKKSALTLTNDGIAIFKEHQKQQQFYEGISNKGLPTRTSSWSYRGKSINYFPFIFKDFILSKITHKEFPIINENSSYEIPVENINGNILCIASSKDEVWNALQASKRIQKRLAQYNFQYRFNSTYVENAGHMVTIPGQPNNRYKTTDKKLIMDDTYETWNRTVSYFKDNLKQNYTKSS